MQPSPYLVLTSLIYLFPAYKAYLLGELYLLASLLCLSTTSVIVHITYDTTALLFDRIAIVNYVGYGIFLSSDFSPKLFHTTFFPLVYAIYVHGIGSVYSIYCFDPDWYVQQFWHGLIHIFSAYSSFMYLDHYALTPIVDTHTVWTPDV
jgi:hypothetical protein